VSVRCDEACGLTTKASARLSVAGRTRKWGFAPTTRPAPAGRTVRVKLRLTVAMRRALSRRVAAGAKLLVRAVVTARDAAGNATPGVVYLRVVG